MDLKEYSTAETVDVKSIRQKYMTLLLKFLSENIQSSFTKKMNK